jgi:hypothetical protein
MIKRKGILFKKSAIAKLSENKIKKLSYSVELTNSSHSSDSLKLKKIFGSFIIQMILLIIVSF